MYAFLFNWIKDNIKRQEGQAMAEYGIILALVAAAVIVTLALLGTKIEGFFTQIVAQL